MGWRVNFYVFASFSCISLAVGTGSPATAWGALCGLMAVYAAARSIDPKRSGN